MDSDILRVVLGEFARRMDPTLQGSGATDVGASEIARTLHIPNEEVESALDHLADKQLVTRHMLGRYTLTREGLSLIRHHPELVPTSKAS